MFWIQHAYRDVNGVPGSLARLGRDWDIIDAKYFDTSSVLAPYFLYDILSKCQSLELLVCIITVIQPISF